MAPTIPSVLSDEVEKVFTQVLQDVAKGKTVSVSVDGKIRRIPRPFPSPEDWRDGFIYFLMIDRFNNADKSPKSTWNKKYDYHQGGTFNGVKEQLGYIQKLGAKAVWLSPVLKSASADWAYIYPGYGAQNFLTVDDRFGTEQELADLVNEAHARGLYVILDIVINHAAHVFDYPNVIPADNPAFLSNEEEIEWLDRTGQPRGAWRNGAPPVPPPAENDAIWPSDLQRPDFFRRRGNRPDDDVGEGEGFIRGDFETMRQLVGEYKADRDFQADLRQKYGLYPVLSILVRSYQYLLAKFDFDGYRIDTIKYVSPDMVEMFGNAMREFALSVGKKNFFTFGEINDPNERIIASFIGRNSGDGYGIDAALDFPLKNALGSVVKGFSGPEALRQVFARRKEQERELLSSHGEAGRYFVSFLDNHDMHNRFKHPDTNDRQLTQALALLFSLQGIPCVYYGTEQGLQGTVGKDGKPALDSFESVREALWGKPSPFDTGHPMYRDIQALAKLRSSEPPLRYGRLYFREVSLNRQDFGQSSGESGVVAFSRILADREVVVIANTSTSRSYSLFVLTDPDLNRTPRIMKVAYSNFSKTGEGTVQLIQDAVFYNEDKTVRGRGAAAAVFVILDPMEVQVLTPV